MNRFLKDSCKVFRSSSIVLRDGGKKISVFRKRIIYFAVNLKKLTFRNKN